MNADKAVEKAASKDDVEKGTDDASRRRCVSRALPYASAFAFATSLATGTFSLVVCVAEGPTIRAFVWGFLSWAYLQAATLCFCLQ